MRINSKGGSTNSRAKTYLEDNQQGDHLIAYGLINSAVEYIVDNIDKVEEGIYKTTIDDSGQEELEKLKQKKLHYRQQLFTLLKAVLVLNNTEQEQTSTTSLETSTSSSSVIGQNTVSNSLDLSPSSAQRRNSNLDNVVVKIETTLNNYEREKEEYLKQIKAAEVIESSLASQVLTFQEINVSQFFKKSASDALYKFNDEKSKIVGDISRAIMLAFNNIPEITSKRDEKYDPEELIKQKKYYDIDEEFNVSDASMKEAKVINNAIQCISKIRNQNENLENTKISNREERRSSNDRIILRDPGYDKLISSIHNCFFYPKSLENNDISKSSRKRKNVSKQEIIIDKKLEENLAKYFFLLTVSYPFFAERNFSTRVDGKNINKNIYNIIEDSCGLFSEKVGAISKESVEAVKEKYNNLHEKLARLETSYNMDLTPLPVEQKYNTQALQTEEEIKFMPPMILSLDISDDEDNPVHKILAQSSSQKNNSNILVSDEEEKESSQLEVMDEDEKLKKIRKEEVDNNKKQVISFGSSSEVQPNTKVVNRGGKKLRNKNNERT